MLRGLGDEPQPLERLDHLDPQRPDGNVGAVGERAGGPYDMLLVAKADSNEGVRHSEVRICPRPMIAIHSPPVSKALK